jgi:hypothetical protein
MTTTRRCSECEAVEGQIVRRVIGNVRKWVALSHHCVGSQMYTGSMVVSVSQGICQTCARLPRLEKDLFGGGKW